MLELVWKWLAIGAIAPLMLALAIAVLLTIADRALLLHYVYWRWRCAKHKLEPFGTSPLIDAEPVDLIITLVHGTWAPDAEWTHENSVLRRKLTDGLADLRVAWHVLDWSGGNSVSARAGAARKLTADLRALAEKHPLAAHIVIAHSHGGNAVMYALRDDPAIHERLAGVICIATPFLHVRERDLHPFDWRFVRAVFAGAVALPTGWFVRHYLVVAAGEAPEHWYQFDSALGWPVTIAALVLGTLAGWVIAKRCEKHARDSERRLSLPHGKLPPMLVIRAIADEASAVLSLVFAGGMIGAMFWDKIARIANAFVRRASKVEKWVRRHGWRITAVIGIGIAATVGAAMLPKTSWEPYFLGGTTLLLFFVLMLGLFLPGVLSAMVLVAVAVPLVPYGAFVSLLATSVSPSLALTGIYLEIVAEALPLGNHGVTLYDPRLVRQKRTSIVERVEVLMHSRLYSDPRALADVAEWIRTRVAA